MKTLIIGPGGAKGFLFLGALQYMEKKGILSDIKNYVGISIGSIISLLLVAGYNVQQILSIGLDFPNIFPDKYDLSSIITNEKMGLISNSQIKLKLESLIKNKFGDVLSLKKLYDATNLNLTSITLNLTTNNVEYLSYENNPTLSCVDSVLMSSNIPLLFEKIVYNNCIYVDGALGCPFPVDKYDNCIGLYINTLCDDSFYSYIFKITSCSSIQLQKKSIENSKNAKLIELINNKNDTLGIKMDTKTKLNMYYTGYDIAIKHFI